jgi:dolichol-phosphate mannosyltransferase
MKSLFLNYIQFCLVGLTGMAVDMGVLWGLTSCLGLELTLGKVLAAEVAVVNNFVWNERWTFRKAGGGVQRGGKVRRFFRFNLVCLAGMGMSVGLLALQVYGLGVNRFVANFIAIVLVSFWNFFMSRWFGWRVSKV